ncbi:replication protein A 32 kDa subunit-A-like isoform X2 [Osmerus mordax]|uniref:replication protein A 32 kDa subunit-A-like isoform X2 n=1 Tax=Osmerus mordax TaxID=8014 RepID=UPI00350EE51D
MLNNSYSYSGKGHGYNQSQGGFTRFQTRVNTKSRAALQILPCTVSQLLSASESNNVFTIGDTEINQVSLVGIIRRTLSSTTSILYSMDDMSGPPMNVKLWADTENPYVEEAMVLPGTYVKVSGTLRTFQITSHMMEVVHAHMQLGGIAYHVNRVGDELNSSADYAVSGVNQRSLVGGHSAAHTETCGLTTRQNQVLNMVKCCVAREGISLQDLSRRLGYLSMSVIRLALKFLLNEGHVFSTIDEEHFKAIENSG